MREPAVETAGQHRWQKKVVGGQSWWILIITGSFFCLLSPLSSSYLFPSPLRKREMCHRQSGAVPARIGEHQQLPSIIFWQLCSAWLSPSGGLLWFSSLLPNCCLPGRSEISPPFHTSLAMANVLKRYRRKETDTQLMWCPRSHTPEGTDGLTKGECLHCLPSKILTAALWAQPVKGCRIRHCALCCGWHQTAYFLVFLKQENGKK